MFCPKCGTEIQNNSRFCTRCGYRLDNSNFSNCISHTQNRKGNVTSNSTIRLIIIISAIGLVLFLIWLLGDVSLESANAEENIRKLKTFTSLEKENDIYVFNYNDQWSIRYSDENEAVRFNDANAGQCVCWATGRNEIGNDGTFGYDFSDNAFRLYTHYEGSSGDVTIIEYDVDKDKFLVMVDLELYNTSKEFDKELRESGIIKVFQSDLNAFKSDLNSYGMSIDDVSEISYSDF